MEEAAIATHTKSLNRQILLAKHYRFNYELERSIQDRIKEWDCV